MVRLILLLANVWLFLVPPSHAQQPLTKLEKCTLVPTPWADGDSFLVQPAEGTEFTLRLYGADCLEWHVTDETDARRLREQRRYFGISKIGDTAASIEMAKGFGKAAADRVSVLLQKPFTVYTAFADARGDGKHKRVYGFITLEDGRDLAAVLVGEGLARAFGVNRETPTGESNGEYRDTLRDLELQAAKRGIGIWAKTDWDALPEERRQQREEEADLGLASDKKPPAIDFVLDPNTAARDELMQLPGVGEATADRIIEARPFQSIEDLRGVSGIGPAKLEKLRPHLLIR